MTTEEYRWIAAGWFALIVFLSVCWVAMLRRFGAILTARQEATRTRISIAGIPALIRFIFRSEYQQTGDTRLVNVCQRMRHLLFAYVGCIIAFILFLTLMRPRY